MGIDGWRDDGQSVRQQMDETDPSNAMERDLLHVSSYNVTEKRGARN
jgi:hypothetical protein